MINRAISAMVDERPALKLFAVALFARIVSALVFADISAGVQIWEYGVQGQCAAETGGDLCMYDWTGASYASALMPPLPSYLWLLLFSVFGVGESAHAGYVAINILFGAACAPLMLLFARAAGLKPLSAFLAGGLIAGYPTFIFVSHTYHATTFSVAFMLGFAILWLRAVEAKDARAALAAGALAGLAALTRNEFLILAGGATLLMAWLMRDEFRRGLRPVAALALGVGLVVSPWTIRNYVVFERVIPVGSQAGHNLWLAFGPYARGSYNEAFDSNPQALEAASMLRRSVGSGDRPGDRYEMRQQQAYFDAALPSLEAGGLGRVVALTVEKFAVLWLFDWTDPITHSVFYWLPWLIVQMLALSGLVALLRARAPPLAPNAVLIIALTLGTLTGVYSVFGVLARYRLHIEPFIFLFAAIGAVHLAMQWRPLKQALSSSRAAGDT